MTPAQLACVAVSTKVPLVLSIAAFMVIPVVLLYPDGVPLLKAPLLYTDGAVLAK